MSRARDNANLGAQAGSGLDASDITTGVLPVGVTGGSGLNALSASNLSAGVVPDARMPNLTGDITTSEGAVATSITADAVGTDELANDVVINTSGAITTTSTTGITVNSTEHAYAVLNGNASSSAVWIQLKQGGTGRWLAGCEGNQTDLQFYDSASSGSRFRIAQAGDVTVNTGDLIFGTAGKGVVLGATTNVAANTLDDYEVGAWTPAEIDSQCSITNNRAHYRKVGAIVCVWASIGIASNSDTNPLNISLPVPCDIGSYYAGGGSVSYHNLGSTYGNGLRPNIENGGTSVFFLYSGANPLTCANASGLRIDFQLQYIRA